MATGSAAWRVNAGWKNSCRCQAAKVKHVAPRLKAVIGVPRVADGVLLIMPKFLIHILLFTIQIARR